MQNSRLRNLLLLVFAGVVSGAGWICTASMVKYASAMLVTGQRFLISGLVLLPIILMRKLPRHSIKMHLAFLLQGTLTYCLYCTLAAFALKFIVSGLVAVIVTLMFAVNAWLENIFFKRKIGVNVIIGGVLAVCGVIILVKDDILNANHDLNKLIGLISAFGAVFVFSAASIVSKSITMRGVSVIQSTVFSMIYGALVCLIIELITTGQIMPKEIFNQEYLIAISAIGIIIAPICYTSYNYLIKSVGASEASFLFIISPVIAIIISILLEGLVLDYTTVFAVLLTIMGTIITIIKAEPPSTTGN